MLYGILRRKLSLRIIIVLLGGHKQPQVYKTTRDETLVTCQTENGLCMGK